MIFLTGASGFLGKSLIDKLSKLNIEVCCLSRQKRQNFSNNIKWRKADLTVLPFPNDLLKDCSIIIHAAGAIKGSITYLNSLNYHATKELILMAKKEGIKKFIFISSTDAVMFDTAYARSKRDGEETVKNSGLNWLIIRPSVIFGVNDTKNFTQLNNLIKRSPIIFLPHKGLFRWEPVFADDLAEYIIKCAADENISNKCLNIVGPEILTFYDIVNQLEKHNNVERIKIPISSSAVNFFQKLATVTLGAHKADEIFSTFKDKIVPEESGKKIRLSTRFNQVYA